MLCRRGRFSVAPFSDTSTGVTVWCLLFSLFRLIVRAKTEGIGEENSQGINPRRTRCRGPFLMLLLPQSSRSAPCTRGHSSLTDFYTHIYLCMFSMCIDCVLLQPAHLWSVRELPRPVGWRGVLSFACPPPTPTWNHCLFCVPTVRCPPTRMSPMSSCWGLCSGMVAATSDSASELQKVWSSSVFLLCCSSLLSQKEGGRCSF